MKPKSSLLATGMLLLATSATFAAPTTEKGKSESASKSSAAHSSAAPAESPRSADSTQSKAKAATPTPAEKGSTVKPSSELAASLALEEANKEHIRSPRTPLLVATPPPAARAEKKTPSPSPGLVWVPGHWVPFQGEWHWNAGEWGFPATPISVWIEPTYDAKTKTWTAGYWQPDREVPYDTETRRPDEDRPPTPKFL
ncbi:MAG: YXWGXW repeat-containing protein [Opitutus sp.]